MTLPTRPTLRHVPALDGLRGLAVAAVVAYHAGFGWARGGFLGVSAFFTLSGYLITSLLLVEWDGTGRVSLREFWGRRFRRLLPAALAVIAGVVVAARFLADSGQLADLRGDVLAGLGYVANWRFVLDDRSYGDLFTGPSPLQHLWSLAIEEQFYVLFPLLTVGLLRIGGGRRRVLGVTLTALDRGLGVVDGEARSLPCRRDPGVLRHRSASGRAPGGRAPRRLSRRPDPSARPPAPPRRRRRRRGLRRRHRCLGPRAPGRRGAPRRGFRAPCRRHGIRARRRACRRSGSGDLLDAAAPAGWSCVVRRVPHPLAGLRLARHRPHGTRGPRAARGTSRGDGRV